MVSSAVLCVSLLGQTFVAYREYLKSHRISEQPLMALLPVQHRCRYPHQQLRHLAYKLTLRYHASLLT